MRAVVPSTPKYLVDALIKKRSKKPIKKLYISYQQNHPFQQSCPILRLNDDLLVYIIKMLLPPPESRLDANSLYNDRETLAPLLRTCHRIGDLIYSTPSFWNYISARMRSVDIRRRKELSGSIPLTINFVTPRYASGKFRSYFFNSVRHVISRWQRVSIPQIRYWDHYFKSHPSLVSLKELSIDQMETYYQEFWKCSFPSLEILRFSTTGFFPSETSFPSLKRCEIITYSIKTEQLRTILSSIPTVESIWIELSLTYDVEPSSVYESTKISLPRLEKLAIKDNRGESFAFLRICSLPKIRTFTLSSFLDGLGRPHIDHMVNERETFPVQFLELGVKCTRSENLTSILKLFPLVHDLHLNVGKELGLARPDWTGINKRRYPNLQSLLMKHGSSDSATLKEMLQSLDREGIKLELTEREAFLV